MKTNCILLILVVLVVPGLRVLQADVLRKGTVTITGSIIQNSDPSTGKSSVKGISIANVLSVLGLGGDARDMRYYYDENAAAYVIAPKSDAAGGAGTPIATVFGFGSSLDWGPDHSFVSVAGDTGLDGNLSGTGLVYGVYPHTVETDSITFTLFGVMTSSSGLKTIMKGRIVDVFKN